MTVTQTWKRTSKQMGMRVQHFKFSYVSGDTSITCTTDCKIIYSYAISPTSVSAKYVTLATVSGNVITITVTDPVANCYLFVTVWGIPK